MPLTVQNARERFTREEWFEPFARKFDGCRPRGRGDNQHGLPELQPRAAERQAD